MQSILESSWSKTNRKSIQFTYFWVFFCVSGVNEGDLSLFLIKSKIGRSIRIQNPGIGHSEHDSDFSMLRIDRRWCSFFLLKFLQKTWRSWRWTFPKNSSKIWDMIDLFRFDYYFRRAMQRWTIACFAAVGTIFSGKKGGSCCFLVFIPCSRKYKLQLFEE